eukprot:CAMPEP_0180641616 /NCGR_PEP_ID=MMETSP1037_2-20121125/46607_1 /TAXON_ID=632150 /ORGANISM="Azadinium spinosum, Strain 3D9" /LENGTH=38 /DNA_ID= /DNA_START= /DNA_END= /DNA_ORIENTATION=
MTRLRAVRVFTCESRKLPFQASMSWCACAATGASGCFV